jgi:hypothetical protein
MEETMANMKRPRTLFLRAALRWAGRQGARPLIEGIRVGVGLCLVAAMATLALGV